MCRVSDLEFDRIHEIGKKLKELFYRDGFTKADGLEDYLVRSVEEATRLTMHTVINCPDSPSRRHYFDDEKGVCLYCGTPFHSSPPHR